MQTNLALLFLQQGAAKNAALLIPAQAPPMLDGNDTLTQQLSETAREQRQQQQVVIAIGTGVSVALTTGFVTWLLKAGVLISTAKSSAPLWSAIDPVPILYKRDIS